MAGFWICLGEVSQGFKYDSGSKYGRAWNKARLWICKSYSGFWICLNKPEYALIVPQYVSILLDNAAYVCKFLNKPE